MATEPSGAAAGAAGNATNEPDDAIGVLSALIAEAPVESTALRGDLPALYRWAGMTSEGSFSSVAVGEHLRGRIRSALEDEHGAWTAAKLQNVQREILIRHAMEDLPLQPMLATWEVILEVARKARKVIPLSAAERWRTAVFLARECVALGGDAALDATWTARVHTRELNVGRSAKRLRADGATVVIKGGRVEIPEADLRSFARKIFEGIERLGGVNVARAIFQNKQFDPRQQRYRLVARVESAPRGRDASIPLGYLLQLAVRAAATVPPPPQLPADAERIWSEVTERARALVATYNVERYTPFDSMFPSSATLATFVQTLAVWDSAFSIVQMRPSDVGRVLRGLFDWLTDDDTRTHSGFALSSAIVVAETIISRTWAQRGPQQLTLGEISGLLTAEVTGDLPRILQVFTHQAGTTNRDYLLPTEIVQETFGSKPLLPGDSDSVVVMDPSWCAPAFLVALTDFLRTNGFPKVDSEIGLAAERFLAQQLRTAGLQASRGTYRIDREDGECDVVIETQPAVVFLEVKKKPLTRRARSGDDIGLFVDLSRSLVAAQVQLGGHEVRIRKHGNLVLEEPKGTPSHTLKLQGRDVERIAVTTMDFGTLQDRVVLHRFLEVAANSSFQAAAPENQPGLDELRASLDSLVDQHKELVALDSSRNESPFFNCWFLSVPQILVLLDGVTSAKQLWDRLRVLRHMTSGRHDFYADLADFVTAGSPPPQDEHSPGTD